MKEQQIEHHGTVERILGHRISVTVTQDVACSGCAAAQLCNSSQKKKKSVVVFCSNPLSYRVGQEVTIVGKLSLGLRATLWAYVMPLLVLMSVLMLVDAFTGRQGLAAMLALLSLGVYSAVLWAFRSRFQREFSFRIKT